MDQDATRMKRQKATSVSIEPERVYRFFRARRLPLAVASEMLGYSRSWLSVCMSKRRMSYWALDTIGTEWNLSPEEVIELLGTDEERALAHLV